jgi:hypothetical protein
MAIVSSGAVSLGDIQTEFGGTNPASLSEYYSTGNAPASGEIQLAADFYGTSNTIDLDFTLQGGTVSRGAGTYSSVSIGTANANRMVVLQGVRADASVAPTAVTIGGISAGLVRNGGNYVAYAKVPTGTTATIVISGGSGVAFTTQIYTLNTVNTAPTQTSVQTLSVPANTSGSSTMTQNPVETEGVFIWGMYGNTAGPGSPIRSGTGLSTSNPNGVTIRASFGVVGTDFYYSAMGYSECTTTDSRYARTTNNNNPGKGNAALYSAFTYFKAN